MANFICSKPGARADCTVIHPCIGRFQHDIYKLTNDNPTSLLNGHSSTEGGRWEQDWNEFLDSNVFIYAIPRQPDHVKNFNKNYGGIGISSSSTHQSYPDTIYGQYIPIGPEKTNIVKIGIFLMYTPEKGSKTTTMVRTSVFPPQDVLRKNGAVYNYSRPRKNKNEVIDKSGELKTEYMWQLPMVLIVNENSKISIPDLRQSWERESRGIDHRMTCGLQIAYEHNIKCYINDTILQSSNEFMNFNNKLNDLHKTRFYQYNVHMFTTENAVDVLFKAIYNPSYNEDCKSDVSEMNVSLH